MRLKDYGRNQNQRKLRMLSMNISLKPLCDIAVSHMIQ